MGRTCRWAGEIELTPTGLELNDSPETKDTWPETKRKRRDGRGKRDRESLGDERRHAPTRGGRRCSRGNLSLSRNRTWSGPATRGKSTRSRTCSLCSRAQKCSTRTLTRGRWTRSRAWGTCFMPQLNSTSPSTRGRWGMARSKQRCSMLQAVSQSRRAATRISSTATTKDRGYVEPSQGGLHGQTGAVARKDNVCCKKGTPAALGEHGFASRTANRAHTRGTRALMPRGPVRRKKTPQTSPLLVYTY